MSSFYDDLIASDETLANADAGTDLTIKSMIAQAAKDGSVKTLRMAIDRGQVNFSTDQDIVNAAVNVIGNDRSANRMNNKEMERRVSFIGEWVDAVAGPRPAEGTPSMDAWNKRTGSMLGACFNSYMNGHDHVAGELIKMGVPSNGKFESSQNSETTELSGARLKTSEKTASVTVLGKAINNRSRWVKDMIANDPDGLPVVATVSVGGKSQDLNAAGYALALGDTKCLREIISGLSKHKLKDSVGIQEKMGAAIDHAEKLGLLEFGPDEVVHGVAMLLAAGAKVKNPAGFLAKTITIVEIPGLANDPLATKEQAKEVAEAVKARTFTLPSAMLYAPNPDDVNGAIKAMVQMGWNVNQPVQPSSSLDEAGAKKLTCAHLAAFNAEPSVVSTLKFLGADMGLDDGQGSKPIDYARFGSLAKGRSFDLDFARTFDAAYMPRSIDVFPDAAIPVNEKNASEVPGSNARSTDTNTSTTTKPSTSTNSSATSKMSSDIDDANAQAMMAANENNAYENHGFNSADFEMFENERVTSLGPSAKASEPANSKIPAFVDAPAKTSKAPPAVQSTADAGAPSKPLSTFEKMKLGQAARNAIPRQDSFSAKP